MQFSARNRAYDIIDKTLRSLPCPGGGMGWFIAYESILYKAIERAVLELFFEYEFLPPPFDKEKRDRLSLIRTVLLQKNEQRVLSQYDCAVTVVRSLCSIIDPDTLSAAKLHAGAKIYSAVISNADSYAPALFIRHEQAMCLTVESATSLIWGDERTWMLLDREPIEIFITTILLNAARTKSIQHKAEVIDQAIHSSEFNCLFIQ